jgi:predicted O-methyltransferase YrrM
MEQLKNVIKQKIPGDVLELGVGFGITSVALAKVIKENNSNKKVYACDTFSGLPSVCEHDGDLKVGDIYWEIKHIQERIKEGGVENQIEIVQGKIENTLPGLVRDRKFSFVFFDMDIYSSTKFALNLLSPLLPQGAIIGFHDYGFKLCPGIKKAVDETDMSGFFRLNILQKEVLFFKKS